MVLNNTVYDLRSPVFIFDFLFSIFYVLSTEVLFIFYRLLFTVADLRFTIYPVLFSIYYLLCSIFYFLSSITMDYLLFTVSDLRFTIYDLRFTIYYLLFLSPWAWAKHSQPCSTPSLRRYVQLFLV